MIELKPFTENDFEVFKSWIHSEEELFQFAGPIFSYPLTDNQLRDYLKMTDKKPLKVVLRSTNQTIGHCELNFQNGKNRLSRILVGNKVLRGQKIGEQIVIKMVDLLFKDSNVIGVEKLPILYCSVEVTLYDDSGMLVKLPKVICADPIN